MRSRRLPSSPPGTSISSSLTKSGKSPMVAPDMNAERGEGLAGELGERVRFARCDVTSESEVAAAIEVAAQAGPLRAAVSCAGVGWAQRTVNREGVPHDIGVFGKVVKINLIGTFNVLRLAAAAMA